MFKKKVGLMAIGALLTFGAVTTNLSLPYTTVYATSGTEKLEAILTQLSISQSQKQFIRDIYPGVVKSHQEQGILPSITIAQAILESSWGNSELAKEPNYNLFGIKAGNDWTGATYTKNTNEYVNGQLTTVPALFRVYNSYGESISDHGRLFTSSPWRANNYAEFLKAKDYIAASQALQKAGYATSPTYATTLQRVIEQYQLNALDDVSSTTNDSGTTGFRNNSSQAGLTMDATNALVYMENGVINPSITGVYAYNGSVYYVNAGRVDTALTGLVHDPVSQNWYYVENGKVATDFTDLVQHPENKEWFYVENGKINWTFNGVVHYTGNKRWFYVESGKINWKLTGLFVDQPTQSLVFIQSGEYMNQFTGLMQDPVSLEWYYVQNGKVDTTFTDLVQHPVNKNWYYVQNGKINWAFNGVVQYQINKQWYYVESGKINWGLNGLLLDQQTQDTVYIQSGGFNNTFTGLVQHQTTQEWLYVEEGKVNAAFKRIVQHQDNKRWFYVEDGKINWDVTGFVLDEVSQEVVYVQNGEYRANVSGLVQDTDTQDWYYLENGKARIDFTGLVQHPVNKVWFYVENGKINWNFTGLVQHQTNGRWFYVVNGQINWGHTGLVQHQTNGGWFYVVNGQINWGYTGVVDYQGTLYYVKNGQINWSFSGEYSTNKVLYTIANGVVVEQSEARLSKVIFIDPGHGGIDSGAYYYGIKESDLVLDVSKRLRTLLQDTGYSVIMTREDDTHVDFRTERSRIVNETNADIFISIHFNATGLGHGSSATGIETYWYQYDPEYQPKINQELHNDPVRLKNSEVLATALQSAVIQETGATNRGVRRETFAVLRETAKPAALIELGFMDNYAENQKN